MNVALFLTFDYSLKTWFDSGTLERELKIFKQLEERKKVKFYIFSYSENDDLIYKKYLNSINVISIYKKHPLPRNKILKYLFSFLIPFKLKEELKKIDIIQQNQLQGSWVSMLCSILYKKPYFLRTGYDMYQFSIYENKSFFIKNLYKILTFISIKYSDLYSVTSVKDYDFLSKNFKNTKNLVIRPNWVEQQNIENNNRTTNRILCVGRLTYQKNLYYLLQEFKNTKDKYTIDFIGLGEELEDLKAYAKKNNVSVKFLNRKSHSELMEIYKNYQFFISTSLFEGHPKTLIEAMSSGCTVFASNIPAHKEIINNYENGILFDLKKGELIKIFEKYKLETVFLKDIGKNAMNTTLKKYSINSLVDSTFKDYTTLKSNSSK